MHMWKSLIILFLNSCTTYALDDSWAGQWFPNPPNVLVDNNPTLEYKPQDVNKNEHVQMGVVSDQCDDGKTNLTIDWDDSPINYTCFDNKFLYLPDPNVEPIEITYNIPKEYSALHSCMDKPISYQYTIPTYGTHRPLWPKYGEYLFVPVQRWLHNLEHGAIVMLYHPCANSGEVQYLKKIVKGCLYRHIITPYTLLSSKRPLALVAWGHSLEMSKVDISVAYNFIKKRALQGPEKNSKDGQYDYKLIKPARVVSDKDDTNLCPNNNWF